MLTLAATNTLAGGASAATEVTCTVFGMELNAGVEVYKALDQRQLAAAPATIYTAPASTTAFVKSILVVNNGTVPRSFQLFFNGTAAANAITPPWTLGAGESAVYEDGHGWSFYTALGQLKDVEINSNWILAQLAADASNSTVTNAAVAGLDLSLAIGSYAFEYFLMYQAAAATTGIKFAVDYLGTVTNIVYQARFADILTTAASVNPDQESPLVPVVMSVMPTRVDNTTLGPLASVDTLNANMLMIIEGIITVSTANVLRLMHGSEVAAATTVKAGSIVRALKVA